MQATGQVDKTHFVHRVYEESHVRIRLVSFAESHDPDNIIGTAVETRVGDPNVIGDCEYNANVFGPSAAQFTTAAEVFRRRVEDYLTKGKL